jgi:hypothetical protein
MVAMEVAIRDDRGLLKQAAGRDVEGEPDELGVRPIQGGGRESGSARRKAPGRLAVGYPRPSRAAGNPRSRYVRLR